MTQETDRELLELAAKAAAIEINWFKWERLTNQWNPLVDDGDAFRLADTLGLFVRFGEFGGIESPVTVEFDRQIPDRLAATRRAILRAAAEIGKAMP